jgi:uncharacterized protein (DUF1778 family)
MPTPTEEWRKISARVPKEKRASLEEAAELVGVTVNQCVIQSASEDAQRILERETVIRLSSADARCDFVLMENPPKPNKRLREAVNRFIASFCV